MNDAIGITAIGYAGYRIGQGLTSSTTDLIILAVLILVGFYFAVILS